MKSRFLVLALLFGFLTFAQGLVHSTLNTSPQNSGQADDFSVQCGSHHLMEHLDRQQPGFQKASDQALQSLVQNLRKQKKSSAAVLNVPVVFHVVHNSPDENLPDSVIQNQLDILNESFRRQNADTATLRSEFLPYVDDARIEFQLATVDPNGAPTNGIVRTNTTIQHFGGILPYAQNQQQQIQQWVNDSLFYNIFRITQSSLGGSDAWDTARYLNIWIGDLRIFEPQINNFEELVFVGLATPPATHPNFAGTGFDTLALEQGVLLHYVAVGSNNPASFPNPYGAFNNLLDEGGIAVHEVGHYLGLRHIWGDGGCNADDFISDTPLASAAGQFTCNKNRNSCLDSIDGVDLPDMAENFMDYSSDACMNSFTKEQVQVMRNTLISFRPNLFAVSTPEWETTAPAFTCYPNPTSGQVKIEATGNFQQMQVQVLNAQGKFLNSFSTQGNQSLEFSLDGPAGMYIVQIQAGERTGIFKVLKQP